MLPEREISSEEALAMRRPQEVNSGNEVPRAGVALIYLAD